MANFTEYVFEEQDQPGDGSGAGAARRGRPRYRPPIGIPAPYAEAKWKGPVFSFLLHATILLLILAPIFAADVIQEILQQGAGGPGPAGGGGGGRQGSGGEQTTERLQYIQVAPPPAPVPTPTDNPVIPPPKEETPITMKIDIKMDMPTSATLDMALTAGIGGGTGRDGSSGSGPGSGGGVGSGVGTGRGSNVGPGTGGGEGTIYPPTVVQTFLPPYPVPEKIRPFRLVAIFDVDERGNVVNFTFNQSKDAAYNRRLKELLAEVRFRPATKWDGTPIPAKAQIEYFL